MPDKPSVPEGAQRTLQPPSIPVLEHNRRAWDEQVKRGDRWTLPVSSAQVAAARRGEWHLELTPTRRVPASWFGELQGTDVLGLAAGGGQQCPLLAAAGANVTVFDVSPRQLARDREVATREGLDLCCIEGDMADLAPLGDESFDLIFHPVSNCFVQDVRPVWREAYRVLRPGGVLLAGFINPIVCLFDAKAMETGDLKVRHSLPYSDLTSISEQERREVCGENEALTFGHTLSDQLGGQTAAGFLIADLYEDDWGSEYVPLDRFTQTFLATRALKPR